MSSIELENGDLLVIKQCKGLPEPATDGKIITAIVSTEQTDSDGDIIHQGKNKKGAGWVLDHFNKMPLLLWQHDRMTPNLSSPNTAAKVSRHADLGKVLLLDPVEFDEGDAFAMHIAGKVMRKVLRESSVGFRGVTTDPIRNGEGQATGLEFFEQKLVEVSFANRGSNTETDTAMKSMLGMFAHAQEVQGGSDAEIAELKAELEDLTSQFHEITGLVKDLGDSVAGLEEATEIQVALKDRRTEAVKALHDSLKRIGNVTE